MKKYIIPALFALTLGTGVREANAAYCREFTQTINVGNSIQSGYGTACQQPDGSWQIVSADNYIQSAPVVLEQAVPEPVIVQRPIIVRRPVFVDREPESRVVVNVPLWFGASNHGYRQDYHGYRHYDRGHGNDGHDYNHYR